MSLTLSREIENLKTLYGKGLYKQCAAQSQRLLADDGFSASNPMNASYAHFLRACALEHSVVNSRDPVRQRDSLTRALISYADAANSLPNWEKVEGLRTRMMQHVTEVEEELARDEEASKNKRFSRLSSYGYDQSRSSRSSSSCGTSSGEDSPKGGPKSWRFSRRTYGSEYSTRGGEALTE